MKTRIRIMFATVARRPGSTHPLPVAKSLHVSSSLPEPRQRKSFAPASAWLALALLPILNLQPTTFAQGTAFTYQGRLNLNGSPANGTYEFRYELHNDPTTNGLVGAPLNDLAVAV